jgi:hypothetical protein
MTFLVVLKSFLRDFHHYLMTYTFQIHKISFKFIITTFGYVTHHLHVQ